MKARHNNLVKFSTNEAPLAPLPPKFLLYSISSQTEFPQHEAAPVPEMVTYLYMISESNAFWRTISVKKQSLRAKALKRHWIYDSMFMWCNVILSTCFNHLKDLRWAVCPPRTVWWLWVSIALELFGDYLSGSPKLWLWRQFWGYWPPPWV